MIDATCQTQRTVRYCSRDATRSLPAPFRVDAAQNVILECFKRGEDDEKTGKETIIVRLFEQFGGHATARLNM